MQHFSLDAPQPEPWNHQQPRGPAGSLSPYIAVVLQTAPAGKPVQMAGVGKPLQFTQPQAENCCQLLQSGDLGNRVGSVAQLRFCDRIGCQSEGFSLMTRLVYGSTEGIAGGYMRG